MDIRVIGIISLLVNIAFVVRELWRDRRTGIRIRILEAANASLDREIRDNLQEYDSVVLELEEESAGLRLALAEAKAAAAVYKELAEGACGPDCVAARRGALPQRPWLWAPDRASPADGSPTGEPEAAPR